MSGKPYRLPDGENGRLIDRKKPVHFTFDGKAMTGFAGDTVASAVMANGRRVLGRSFKYHRPRGLVSVGSDEPNALVGIGEGSRHEPNMRATQVELYEGLTAVSQNRWPSLDFDIGIFNNYAARLFPSGFYYKTFMWPKSFWHAIYEPFIRRAAGLGVAPTGTDPDDYEQIHIHCDVLIAGGGLAGLAAAHGAMKAGKRVILCEEQPRLGGGADQLSELVDGKPALEWAKNIAGELAAAENVQVLVRTTFTGHYHHNYAMALERVADSDPVRNLEGTPRHRLWKIRTRQVIVAGGAQERPIAFANNDRPGILLANAARSLAVRFGVSPGLNGVVFTNNDSAYGAAIALKKAGAGIARIIDSRANPKSPAVDAAASEGLDIVFGHGISAIETSAGGKNIEAVKISALSGSSRVVNEDRIEADYVAVSGGWNPSVHLWCHNGGMLRFDDELATFRPSTHGDNMVCVGAANGTFDLGGSLEEGYKAGAGNGKTVALPKTTKVTRAPLEPLWFSPASGKYNEGNKHFIDYQNDVTAADLELAQREGYVSVEHTKRYTTLGMATDQGKTSNINGLGVIAAASGRTIPQVGTTTFRPPFTPVSFGAIAGTQHGKLFHVIRRTPVFGWHEQKTRVMEPVGDWRRPYCYPRPGETVRDAINREILLVRNSVGILDASTLGKIEIKGPDAGKFLDLIYTNMFSTLKEGMCRYGLMMNEMGFLMDDGVTAKLGDNHYLMHTTSGGAERIAAWLEEWLQTEWWDLKVFVTPVTEQWAQFAVAGPKAREVLQSLDGDIDFDREAFPFMAMRAGTLDGFPVRVYRISFSGELSFEVATPANLGQALWDRLLEVGEPHDIAPYGTEALHVLRAEKGFIVIGDETDGTVTPHDVGMSWAVSKKKADFIGKRSLQQSFLTKKGRKQLVGLETLDPNVVLPDGAHAVKDASGGAPYEMIGHVTSSYWSPTLRRSIAMALIEGGRDRMGETVTFVLEDSIVEAKLVDPVFYDKEGKRQNV